MSIMDPNQQLEDIPLKEVWDLEGLETLFLGSQPLVKAEVDVSCLVDDNPCMGSPTGSVPTSPGFTEEKVPEREVPGNGQAMRMDDLLWLTQSVGLNTMNNLTPDEALAALVDTRGSLGSIDDSDVDDLSLWGDGDDFDQGAAILVDGKSVDITDDELVMLTVRDLNRRLHGLPRDAVTKLKRKRRTLKNRGYAQNCRTKRLHQRDCLEKDNMGLMDQLNRLKAEVGKARRERDYYKRECDMLRVRGNSLSSAPSSPDLDSVFCN